MCKICGVTTFKFMMGTQFRVPQQLDGGSVYVIVQNAQNAAMHRCEQRLIMYDENRFEAYLSSTGNNESALEVRKVRTAS